MELFSYILPVLIIIFALLLYRKLKRERSKQAPKKPEPEIKVDTVRCFTCGIDTPVETALEKKDGTFWCEECEKSLRGDGLSVYKIEIKDFVYPSGWHHYMGVHKVDGVKPKMKKINYN